MKTAIPPNGVTARCVSRRINRSLDSRASISRGTGLSVAFDSIPPVDSNRWEPPRVVLMFSGLAALLSICWIGEGVLLIVDTYKIQQIGVELDQLV